MTQSIPHILVVDDDDRLRKLLRRYLAEQDFVVATADSAESARAQLKSLSFDMMVVDVMMPGESGLDLTRWLRDQMDIPVLLLTACGDAEDRIAGLEAGADDYLPKPFEPRELLLRINAILRRAVKLEPDEVTELKLGDCQIDLKRAMMQRGTETITLTSAEVCLLQVLSADIGQVMNREDLAEKVGVNGNSRTVDVQVTRLRKKIEPDPTAPRYLQTIRGEGYVLRAD